MYWKPIINLDEYHNIIEKIYSSLEKEKNEISSNDDEISLMGGTAGIALFYYYIGKYQNDKKIRNKGIIKIESIFNSINNGFSYHTFAGGISGAAWLISHLTQNKYLTLDENDTIGLLDLYLAKSMISDIKSGKYDYLHGAVGLGLYFLNRSAVEKSVDKYLIQLVDTLDEISIKVKNGIKWKSVLDKESCIQGYNLSLSHGISSIITFLSKLYEKNIYKEKVFQLIINSVNYLLSQKLDRTRYQSYFPNFEIENSEDIYPSRMAWCYGDLGIAISIWQAGIATNNEQWKNIAIEILLYSTQRRDLQKNIVLDAGICHGTAGIAHIFNRMYHYTRIEEFKESAIYWLDQTIKMAKFEDGAAGYKAWRTPEYGGYVNEYGLLEGVAGIGLVLLAAISDIEPKWDRCLLLS